VLCGERARHIAGAPKTRGRPQHTSQAGLPASSFASARPSHPYRTVALSWARCFTLFTAARPRRHFTALPSCRPVAKRVTCDNDSVTHDPHPCQVATVAQWHRRPACVELATSAIVAQASRLWGLARPPTGAAAIRLGRIPTFGVPPPSPVRPCPGDSCRFSRKDSAPRSFSCRVQGAGTAGHTRIHPVRAERAQSILQTGPTSSQTLPPQHQWHQWHRRLACVFLSLSPSQPPATAFPAVARPSSPAGRSDPTQANE
jgi:hypothetical protein